MAYVDNPCSTWAVLMRCFSSLGDGLYPGDSGIRWDEFHLYDLIRDSMRGNHPAIPLCMKDLVEQMNDIHPDDVRLDRPRKLKPPPHVSWVVS